MNLHLHRLARKLPTNEISAAFARRRWQGRKFLAGSMAGLSLAVAGAGAALNALPHNARRLVSEAGPEARFLLIRKLAADEKMTRRLREMLVDSGPHGFKGKHLLMRSANWLPAAGLGAGLMYFFDPQWGNERRDRFAGKIGDMVKNADSGRLVTAVAGGALTVSGLRLHNPAGYAGSVLGLGLLARGAANLRVERLLGMGKPHDVQVSKTFTINAPIGQVFDYWRHFENFPRFMSNVKEIRDLGEGRSHWVVEGPAGTRAEWDAETTLMEPNQAIGWRSLPDSSVQNEGVVRFTEKRLGVTEVNVHLSYRPPAGAAGHIAATLFGDSPKQMMDEDLRRLKLLIEQGRLS